jgi:hypothetical protein
MIGERQPFRQSGSRSAPPGSSFQLLCQAVFFCAPGMKKRHTASKRYGAPTPSSDKKQTLSLKEDGTPGQAKVGQALPRSFLIIGI